MKYLSLAEKTKQIKEKKVEQMMLKKLETEVTMNGMAEISRYTRKQIHFNTNGRKRKGGLDAKKGEITDGNKKESFLDKNKSNCSNDVMKLWNRKEKGEKKNKIKMEFQETAMQWKGKEETQMMKVQMKIS
jgi:hypothetical protein